jgi:hypothetical protein
MSGKNEKLEMGTTPLIYHFLPVRVVKLTGLDSAWFKYALSYLK